MKSSQLKVCGITQEEDGENALSVGALFLGFILFDGSPRSIAPEIALAIWNRIKRPGTFSVAVEVDPSPDYLSKIVNLGFDFYQLHFPCEINPERVSEWANIAGKDKLWLAPRISPQDDFPVDLLPFADTFLVDAYVESKFGGTGLSSDWKRFSNWKDKYAEKKWILAGGIGPENLEDALSSTNTDLVDVNSSVEREPGVKDLEKLKKLLPFF